MKVGVQRERAVTSDGTVAAVELPALTALRGLAALTVLLFHSSFVAANFAGGGSPVIFRRGYLAVDLFFFLSGFVLAHVYGQRLAEDRGWRAVGKFLWARFCRIFPASVFTTAVLFLPFATGRLVWPAGFSFKTQFIASLLLIQVPWLGKIVVNSPSWSVSAELYAYLLFPFVVPVILRLRGSIVLVLGFALLIEIAIDHMVFTHAQQDWGWGALFRALPEFTAGVFLYRAYSERFFRSIWEKDATLVAVTAMTVAAYFAGVSDGPIVALLPALLLAAVSNSGRMTGLLNMGPLRWLGEVSYAVYIFQALPLMVAVGLAGVLVRHGLGGARFTVLAALLALGGGVLVHRCVDLPVRAALRRAPDRAKAIVAAYRNATARAMPLVPIAVRERDN